MGSPTVIVCNQEVTGSIPVGPTDPEGLKKDRIVKNKIALSALFVSLPLQIATSCAELDGGSPTEPEPVPTIAGRYNVVTANGVALPTFVVELSGDQIGDDGMAKISMNSGHIQINNGGTCVSSVNRTWATIDDYVIDTSDDTDTCTWTQAGSTITFTHGYGVFWRDDGSSDTATLSGNRLTMTFSHWHAGTMILVLER